MIDGKNFSLCLTHDVDRPYKSYRCLYYSLDELDHRHLLQLLRKNRPYWQFEKIMRIEEDHNVRSTFFFLNEKNIFRDIHPKDWVYPKTWKLYAGRYEITDPDIVKIIQQLDAGGWEIGVHGSYDSYRDPERLAYEKRKLEDVLGHEVYGIRQHYLNLNKPDTWEHQRNAGFKYDATLGSRPNFGFPNGYKVKKPFNDEFVVFPLNLMDGILNPSERGMDEALSICESLLDEAAMNEAVMTVNWHPSLFNEDEFGEFRAIYEELIKMAKERGAWIGPIIEVYKHIWGEI